MALAALGWQVFSRSLGFFRASATLQLLRGVNLIFHEAGGLFLLFGQFLYVLGGSALQILVPALCAGYFLLHHQTASFTVALFWTGKSITDIAIYMADAPTMALPLLGGEGVLHDWNYVGSSAGRDRLAAVTYGIGMLAVAAAVGLLGLDLLPAWNHAIAPAQPETWRQA